LIANSSKPDPNGSLSQIRAYLDKNAVDKKAIVLNKLNFQNESSISSEMNFNSFLILAPLKVQNLAYSRKGFTVLLMLNTLEMAHNSFSPEIWTV
jgi:hypothetical protein